MTITREEHLAFWKSFAEKLGAGTPLVRGLHEIRSATGNAVLADAIPHLCASIEEGASLSAAMAPYGWIFSRTVVDLARAGEAGGVLEVIAQRIVAGIEDGSMPLPGIVQSGDEQSRFWRVFAWMISSGVPVLQALDDARLEVAGEPLARAAAGIRHAVLDGRSISDAMGDYPDVFAPAVRSAVSFGEATGDLDKICFRIAEALTSGDVSKLPVDAEELSKTPGPRRLISTAIILAVQKRASDIHFDPNPDETSRVRLRIDGVLHALEIPEDMGDPRPVRQMEVVNRLKIMGGMDIAERRLPQDGRIETAIASDERVRRLDLRVSTAPVLHGERACIRILSRDAVRFDLKAIGLLEDDQEKVRQLMHSPRGIVLCAGPTGSGKTTLFYSMLQELDRDLYCVMSLEDPVEYEIEGVAQIQVQPQVGLTFARALRSIMRQDPDVILVGEIRDTETANMVAQCALTGHLVLTSLHANDAPGALKRLVDMGVAPFVVNASVAGVISQRLVRVLCKECRQPIEVPAHSLPLEAAEFLATRKKATFYAPKGCDACLHTGYRGRTAIHEVLIPDDAVRKAVSDDPDEAAIRRAAVAAGMRTLLIAGLEKAARGITSVQEVLRVVGLERAS